MSEAEKTTLEKRPSLRSKLFTKELFEEKELPQEHKNAKTHHMVKDKTWLHKIGNSNTTNLWHHLKRNHLNKNPKKAKNLMVETQNALVPSADMIKNDILENFKVEQKRMSELFQSAPGRISFALDSWISMNSYSFLAITVHWITKNWRLQDKLLDFIDLSGPYSDENLCNAFVRSCHKFGILTKIFAVTSDNTSNNITFMKYLENTCQRKNISFNATNSHCQCLAHIINLVVQEILKQVKAGEAQIEDEIMDDMDSSTNAGEIIPKLHKLVVKVKLSPQRQERFARHAEAANLKELSHILDVRTWWNSTFDMLSHAFMMREAIDAMVNSDKDLRNFEITDDEWDKINEIISVLKIFVQTTKILSTAKYPMLSSSIPIYNYLMDRLEAYCENFDSSNDIVIAVKAGLKKLEFYYEKSDETTMYTIATVLDPRFKLGYYEDNKWKQSFIHYAKDTVLNAYNTNYAPGSTNVEVVDDNDNEFLDHIFGKKKNHQNEVEIYLKNPRADQNQDVLLWWKLNEVEYTHLAAMARDYLAIAATSVPVERIFSGGTDLITAKRSNLKKKNNSRLYVFEIMVGMRRI
ncbi:hypothetical protein RclHR1_13820001 [Rhizophagus clarus]|uniref:HAT C-terminal dimerisation domain-containing protein n=1 Tax=Rhizophagus clarus TaxID=94130 RepID=A0A2Z6QRN3_9GLOM|nr:hypothetical protein RclHR1_13820001 [Rhizophagus clarus]